MGATDVGGHKKAENPQLEGEDPESEVMEENHKRGTALEKEWRKIEVTHHKLRVLGLELSDRYPTRAVCPPIIII